MRELVLTSEVMRYAEDTGLLVHHCPDSRRCEGTRGLPDLIIAGAGGILLAELKGPDGETSADQDRWLYTLHRGGVPYAVWKPRHWEDGTVQAQLEALARGRRLHRTGGPGRLTGPGPSRTRAGLGTDIRCAGASWHAELSAIGLYGLFRCIFE